jgi:hypothetical protein
VTGGRWRIVLGDVLAEHVVELRGRARVWPSKIDRGRYLAGVLGAAAPLGMYAIIIGGGRTSPWREAIAGICSDLMSRAGGSKPVPAPRTRYEVRASLLVLFDPGAAARLVKVTGAIVTVK